MYALKPMGIPGKAPAHVKAWTQQEDDLLITLYPTHTSQEIGAQINRTAASVRNRISALHKQGRVKLKAGRLSRGANRSHHQAQTHKISAAAGAGGGVL